VRRIRVRQYTMIKQSEIDCKALVVGSAVNPALREGRA